MKRECVYVGGRGVSVCMCACMCVRVFTVDMASRIPLCAIIIIWCALCTYTVRGLATCQSNWLNSCVQYVFRGTQWIVPDKMIVCWHNKKHLTLLSRPQPRIYTPRLSVCLSVLTHLCICLPVCLAFALQSEGCSGWGSPMRKSVEVINRSETNWATAKQVKWWKWNEMLSTIV